MMDVKDSIRMDVYKIHVVDRNELNHLTSTYFNFESKKEMFEKWQELINENHYSLSMMYQETTMVNAFHF